MGLHHPQRGGSALHVCGAQLEVEEIVRRTHVRGRQLQRGREGLLRARVILALQAQDAKLAIHPGVVRTEADQLFEGLRRFGQAALLSEPLCELIPTPDIARVFREHRPHEADGFGPLAPPRLDPSVASPQRWASACKRPDRRRTP